MNITKIYLVENCHGNPNKVYIGKTKGSRKYPHIRNFGKNIKYTYIDEINSLDRKLWEPLETFWIHYFHFLGFELQNIKQKGGSGPDYHTQETKLKMSNSAKGKFPQPILQYDLEGNFIKEFENINQIYKELKISDNSGIYNCCRGNISKSHGYKWRYKKDGFIPKISFDNKRNSTLTYKLIIKDKFIGVFENRNEMFKYNIDHNIINKCLLSGNNNYKDYKIIKIVGEKEPKIIKNKRTESNKGKKPKSLICNENGIIYKSVEDCSKEMNLVIGSIRRFLNGKYGGKTLKGFTFSYL